MQSSRKVKIFVYKFVRVFSPFMVLFVLELGGSHTHFFGYELSFRSLTCTLYGNKSKAIKESLETFVIIDAG